MALGENGHIVETQGNNVHYEEIVIVGGGMGGLCFVVALHKYILLYLLQMINLI
jgi:NADH dehydrogenase FAD-containing subunit